MGMIRRRRRNSVNVGTGWGTVTHHFIYGDDKKELEELSKGWHRMGNSNSPFYL